MRKFETKEELIEWIETMHLQNTNGRETEEEMFRLGIEAAIEELTELNLLNIPNISNQKELLIAFANYMEEDKMYERHDEANVNDFLDNYSN